MTRLPSTLTFNVRHSYIILTFDFSAWNALNKTRPVHLEEYVKTRQINHNTVYKYRTQAICTYIVLFPMQIFLQMDLKLVCRLLHIT